MAMLLQGSCCRLGTYGKEQLCRADLDEEMVQELEEELPVEHLVEELLHGWRPDFQVRGAERTV